jgi:hypothetical protein
MNTTAFLTMNMTNENNTPAAAAAANAIAAAAAIAPAIVNGAPFYAPIGRNTPSFQDQLQAFQQQCEQQHQDLMRRLELQLRQPFAPPPMTQHQQQAQPVHHYQQARPESGPAGSKYTCALKGCKAGPALKKSNKSARRTDKHFDPYGKLSGYALLRSSRMGPLGPNCKVVVPESNLFQGPKKLSKAKPKISFNDTVSVTIIPANETSASQRAAAANARLASEDAANAEVTEEMRLKRKWKNTFSKMVVPSFTAKPQKFNPFACLFKMDVLPHIRNDFLAGGNDDDGEVLVPPSSPALSIPAADVPTADNLDGLGSQWVNGVRRSARHQPHMGSVYVNGLRRSARRLAK